MEENIWSEFALVEIAVFPEFTLMNKIVIYCNYIRDTRENVAVEVQDQCKQDTTLCLAPSF